MKLLQDNLLVEQLTREQLGKIVLPETVKDSWLRGRVIQKGTESATTEIEEGSIIVFAPAPPHLGGEYPTIGDEGYIIIPEGIVWAVEN